MYKNTVVCYKLFTWVRQYMSDWTLHMGTIKWVTMTPYPTWPSPDIDTKKNQWLQDLTRRVTQSKDKHNPDKMDMKCWNLSFKNIWRKPEVVAHLVIQATCEVETGKMVVQGDLEQNYSESHLNQISWVWWSVPVILGKSGCWRCWCGKGSSRCQNLSSNASNTKETKQNKKPKLIFKEIFKHSVRRIERGQWHNFQV
jgi:hypothetical protein